MTRATPLLIALGFFALHLALALSIGSIDDEAYYTLWSRDLAPGYYDHPPMVAWMVAAGTALFGETMLGIRLLPLLMLAGGTLLVADIARLLGGNDVAARRAALYWNLSLLTLAVGGLATPDAPSAFFWTAGTWAALRAVRGGGGAFWLVAGLCIGLGGLSKLTNAFLAIGLLLWLVATAEGRRHLAGWKPWAAMAAALAVLSPYLVWNVAHDWLGLERQGSRLAADGLNLDRLGEYLALLLLLPTPLIGWFAFRRLRGPGRERQLLLFSVAPLALYFLWHALHDQVQANWLMPLAAPLAVLAALALAGRSGWAKAAAWTGAGFSGALLALALNPWQPLGSADNPPNQLRGWQEAEAGLAAALAASGASWIATTDYALTGVLALRLADVPVHGLTERQRYLFRGPFPQELCAAPALLVEKARTPEAVGAGLFARLQPAGEVVRMAAGVELARYRLRLAEGLTLPECS